MHNGDRKKPGAEGITLRELESSVEAIFRPGGAISQNWTVRGTSWPDANSQDNSQGAAAGKAALIEAGTGTGKSLAYLVRPVYGLLIPGKG